MLRSCWLAGFEHCASPEALDASGLSAAMAARARGHAKLADDIDAFVKAAVAHCDSSSPTARRQRRHNDEHAAHGSDDWAEDDDYAYAWRSDED